MVVSFLTYSVILLRTSIGDQIGRCAVAVILPGPI